MNCLLEVGQVAEVAQGGCGSEGAVVELIVMIDRRAGRVTGTELDVVLEVRYDWL